MERRMKKKISKQRNLTRREEKSSEKATEAHKKRRVSIFRNGAGEVNN